MIARLSDGSCGASNVRTCSCARLDVLWKSCQDNIDGKCKSIEAAMRTELKNFNVQGCCKASVKEVPFCRFMKPREGFPEGCQFRDWPNCHDSEALEDYKIQQILGE